MNALHSQGLNNAVALDFDYRQQMIYWTDVTTQGSMIRRMHINGSDVQVICMQLDCVLNIKSMVTLYNNCTLGKH